MGGILLDHTQFAATDHSGADERSNRLKGETSPYLLQHAQNPVDWYPWGEEALEKARKENKPIFLSIGYSACHWCHVMERESFEDPEIAGILNRKFVSIKVDREERPDLDDIYMTAVQMLTGAGGWPMTVFLTPDLKPFFGGTYFPPDEKYGRIGFKTLLNRLSEIWEQRRDEVKNSAEEITDALSRHAAMKVSSSGELNEKLLGHGVSQLEQEFDVRWGGFGDAPKFPPSSSLSVLLRRYKCTNESHLVEMTTRTLDRMAYGGLFDQLGGGFHRYSVDEQWLVPHFEKMLYDNALLAQAYLEAYQTTGNTFYVRIADQTLDYVLRDMTDKAGGFYSSEDADSDGSEGKFYIWTRKEIMDLLGPDEGDLVCEYFGVTDAGNFEGANILHVPNEPDEFCLAHDLDRGDWEERLSKARASMLNSRAERTRPGLDDKILVSWNGLMISAFARGARISGGDRYRNAAVNAAGFILEHMVKDGKLMRAYRDGQTRQDGYLDDYAFFAQALIDLYETTFDIEWLETAGRMANEMVSLFRDEDEGNFYMTSERHADVLLKPKSLHDGSEPSGNSAAALVLLKLGRYFNSSELRDMGEEVLRRSQGLMDKMPRGMMNMLVTLDHHLHPGPEIVVAGNMDEPGTSAFLNLINRRFIPNRLLSVYDPDKPKSELYETRIPMLSGKRRVDGHPAVYVCRNYTCGKPVTTADKLDKLLSS